MVKNIEMDRIRSTRGNIGNKNHLIFAPQFATDRDFEETIGKYCGFCEL